MKTDPNDAASLIPYGRDHSAAGLNGLTKREYFAAMALSGLLASPPGDNRPHAVADLSKEYADELIRALNR